MDHSYSTIALIGIIIIGAIVAVEGLRSKDLDKLCATDENYLLRQDGNWSCSPKIAEVTPIENVLFGNNSFIGGSAFVCIFDNGTLHYEEVSC